MNENSNVAPWPPEPAEGQPSVAFEFQLSAAILGRVLSLFYMRRAWPWMIVLAVLFLILEALRTEDWSNPDYFGLVFWPCFGAGAMALVYYATGWVAAGRAFHSTATWQRPTHVILTPTRLFMHGPGFESAQDLALLYAARETSEAFIVYLNAVYVMVWPKSAIGDQESLRQVREYLRDGLPGTASVRLSDS